MAGPSDPAATGTGLREVLHRHWSAEADLEHAIYGSIIGAAGIAVASTHGDLFDVVVTVLVTVAVYWAAERYAAVLAAALRAAGRRRRVLAALRQGGPIVEAGLAPLVVLVLIVLATGNLTLGVFAALGLATALLGGLGYTAARRGGASRLVALAWSLASAVLGGVVIGLKLILH